MQDNGEYITETTNTAYKIDKNVVLIKIYLYTSIFPYLKKKRRERGIVLNLQHLNQLTDDEICFS
jgi:hypothetical protein